MIFSNFPPSHCNDRMSPSQANSVSDGSSCDTTTGAKSELIILDDLQLSNSYTGKQSIVVKHKQYNGIGQFVIITAVSMASFLISTRQ